MQFKWGHAKAEIRNLLDLARDRNATTGHFLFLEKRIRRTFPAAEDATGKPNPPLVLACAQFFFVILCSADGGEADSEEFCTLAARSTDRLVELAALTDPMLKKFSDDKGPEYPGVDNLFTFGIGDNSCMLSAHRRLYSILESIVVLIASSEGNHMRNFFGAVLRKLDEMLHGTTVFEDGLGLRLLFFCTCCNIGDCVHNQMGIYECVHGEDEKTYFSVDTLTPTQSIDLYLAFVAHGGRGDMSRFSRDEVLWYVDAVAVSVINAGSSLARKHLAHRNVLMSKTARGVPNQQRGLKLPWRATFPFSGSASPQQFFAQVLVPLVFRWITEQAMLAHTLPESERTFTSRQSRVSDLATLYHHGNFARLVGIHAKLAPASSFQYPVLRTATYSGLLKRRKSTQEWLAEQKKRQGLENEMQIMLSTHGPRMALGQPLLVQPPPLHKDPAAGGAPALFGRNPRSVAFAVIRCAVSSELAADDCSRLWNLCAFTAPQWFAPTLAHGRAFAADLVRFLAIATTSSCLNDGNITGRGSQRRAFLHVPRLYASATADFDPVPNQSVEELGRLGAQCRRWKSPSMVTAVVRIFLDGLRSLFLNSCKLFVTVHMEDRRHLLRLLLSVPAEHGPPGYDLWLLSMLSGFVQEAAKSAEARPRLALAIDLATVRRVAHLECLATSQDGSGAHDAQAAQTVVSYFNRWMDLTPHGMQFKEQVGPDYDTQKASTTT